jgi:hypothetical protein
MPIGRVQWATSRRIWTDLWRLGTAVAGELALSRIAINKIGVEDGDIILVEFLLATSDREVTLLRLATASNAWRSARVIDGAQVAFHLSLAAWDAGLVDAAMRS